MEAARRVLDQLALGNARVFHDSWRGYLANGEGEGVLPRAEVGIDLLREASLVKLSQSWGYPRFGRYLTNKSFGGSAFGFWFLNPHDFHERWRALVEIYLASLSGSSCAVTISPDRPLHLLKLEAQRRLRRGVVRSLSESTLESLFW